MILLGMQLLTAERQLITYVYSYLGQTKKCHCSLMVSSTGLCWLLPTSDRTGIATRSVTSAVLKHDSRTTCEQGLCFCLCIEFVFLILHNSVFSELFLNPLKQYDPHVARLD